MNKSGNIPKTFSYIFQSYTVRQILLDVRWFNITQVKNCAKCQKIKWGTFFVAKCRALIFCGLAIVIFIFQSTKTFVLRLFSICAILS